MRDFFEKKLIFHIRHQKSGFNLSTLGNRLQHLLLLELHHALNIFIKFFFAAQVHFYSIILWESKIFCSSQWFIHGGFFEKKLIFHRWDQRSGFNLSTRRNSFQHLLLLEFHHALNISTKITFAALVQLYSVLPWESKIFCSPQGFIHGGFFEKKQFFHRWDQKSGFNLSMLRKTLQQLQLSKFHHALNIFIKFLFAALVHSTPFYPKRAIYSVRLSDSSRGDLLKRSSFFIDETKKVVLTCPGLERRYNNYKFWSFTMHSISSSNFFLRPRCTSTPLLSKRARFSVHLSDSSMGDFLKRS